VWINLGNTGTEQEFIDSLVGPQGETGLLAEGTEEGNTTYWNGTEWVLNSNNLYNDGTNVMIGSTTPEASSVLTIESTNQGILIPRMTLAQRDAIATPATGLLIFQADDAVGFYYYDGIKWTNLASSNTNSGSSGSRVGDFYQGGVIFHIFEPGETGYVAGETHGLIAAVSDQSSGIQWYNGFIPTIGTGTSLGTGSANTTAIISAQGATETSYAAGLARAYTGGGYSDWFLPSKDELYKMCQIKSLINTVAALYDGSNFSYENYWSSTEDYVYNNIYSYVWVVNFTPTPDVIGYGYEHYHPTPQQSSDDTSSTFAVRAVRAF
jgi:hypothetical protein